MMWREILTALIAIGTIRIFVRLLRVWDYGCLDFAEASIAANY